MSVKGYHATLVFKVQDMYLFELVNFLHLRLDDAYLLFSDGRVLTDLRQNSNCALQSATKQCIRLDLKFN